MFFRLRKFSNTHSFFLFGPRGTGKSTLLKQRVSPDECLWLDLLESSVEDRFLRSPSDLYAIVKALPDHIRYVVVDEIQKVPPLLDEVHRLIEGTDKIFILRGSRERFQKILLQGLCQSPGVETINKGVSINSILPSLRDSIYRQL